MDSKQTNKKLRYLIHEHHASHLHYDLRLEHNGKLLSWAIPKKPAIDGTKRLAVKVEDHPISYAKFEGTIPEGQYGAGKVKIWDKGFWEPVDFKDKKIIANIHGKKLKGEFVLVDFKEKNWLFFKKKED